jgi:hypothetical protein
MVLVVVWLYLRTGGSAYRTLAQRWTRVMVALFAVSRSSLGARRRRRGDAARAWYAKPVVLTGAPRPTTDDTA